MNWKHWPYWVKVGLVLAVCNAAINGAGIIFFYDSTVPNSDLRLLALPNALIAMVITDRLPDVFGYWSNFYYSIIVWFAIGAGVGFLYGKLSAKGGPASGGKT